MPGVSFTDPGWAGKQADTIVKVVDEIRSRTTKPIVLIARGLVFGLVAVFGAMTALVLALVGSTRALQAVIEWPLSHETAVWVSYLVLGGILLIVGAVLMAKRQQVEAR
jgi:hypothetical protein